MRLHIHEIPSFFANEGKKVTRGTILRLLKRGTITIGSDGAIDITPIQSMTTAELDSRITHGFYAKANNEEKLKAKKGRKNGTVKRPAAIPADMTAVTYERLQEYAKRKKLFIDAHLLELWRDKSTRAGWSLEDAVNLMIDRQWKGIETKYLLGAQGNDDDPNDFLRAING